MAGENIPRSLKNATVTVYDADGSASLTLTAENGDISLNLPNSYVHSPDRADLGTILDGEFQPVTGSMTVQVLEWENASSETFAQVVGGTEGSWTYASIGATGNEAAFEAATSLALDTANNGGTLADVATNAEGPVQVVITYASPVSGGVSLDLVLLDVFTDSLNFSEGIPNTFTWNFTSFMSARSMLNHIQTTPTP